MTKVQLAPLDYLYMNTKDELLTEEEALSRDITYEFNSDLKSKIKHGELILMTITGCVRSGKSVTSLAIQKTVNDEIIRQKPELKKTITRATNRLQNIASDQREWTLTTTKTKLRNHCFVCDEFAKVSQGGANSSTDMQLFQSQLEMFAINQLHSIFNTPGREFDDISRINLAIVTGKQ